MLLLPQAIPNHNSTALGNISALLSSDNIKDGSLATTRWCVDCHYNDSVNANYKGDQWNPAPPLITVNNTGKKRVDKPQQLREVRI